MAGAPYVWSPNGPTPPKVSHKTHQEAHSAAHLMAKAHPGQQFFVMAHTGKGAKVEATADKIVAGLTEALAFKAGEETGAKVHRVHVEQAA